jgi:DNA-binding transcriptional MerR regulator
MKGMTDGSEKTENLYPMRVITRLTGLSAHTIRVWERRYQAVTPKRTSGNSRRYSAHDVRRLSLLRDATSMGYRIKDVASLPDDRLEELVASASEPMSGAAETIAGRTPADQPLNEYLDAVSRFDVRGAADILSRAAMLMEPTRFVLEVVLPMLRQTGERWENQRFSVAQEHLVTHQVRGLLDTLLRLTSTQAGAPRILVGTPQGFAHEFGALVGALLAAARGLEPIYLGADLPLDDLLDAVHRSRVEILLLGVLHRPDDELGARLDEALDRLSEHVEVWVGLPAGHPNHGNVPQARYFDRFEDLDVALTQRVTAGGF